MEDGSVVFNVKLDDGKAQAQLNKFTKKVNEAKRKLTKKEDEQSAIKAELDDARKVADEVNDRIIALRKSLEAVRDLKDEFGDTENAAGWMEATTKEQELTEELKRAEVEVGKLDKEASRLARQYATATKAVNEQAESYQRVKTEAEEGVRKLIEAEEATKGWKGVVDELDKRFQKLGKRITKLAARAFVFTVILQGFRKLKDYLWDCIQTNEDAMSAFAKLKGALLTLAQPLVDIVIPVFTVLVQILTAVISKILQLVSLITGKSAAASAEAAKSLYEQTEALEGTGSAAEDAGKSLASFDTINKLDNSNSSGSSGAQSIAPDFSFLDNVDERLNKIAKLVLLIGAGFALWRISKGLTGLLGTIGTKLSGLMIAIGGIILFFDGLKDAWENGVDWGNLVEILGGAAAAAVGLSLAFGKIGGGFALVIAGAAMIVTAFHDIMENGANLKNVLLLIAGIVATGLGFFLLTGSVIPLVIAGIASVVVAVLALTGHLEEFLANLKENILGGLIEYLVGVWTGEWEIAWHGVKKIFAGVWNTIAILLESAINIIIEGVNWLISQLNKIHFEIPDWVPGIGGKSFGINIPPCDKVTLKRLEIPELARGAVIPPNREFMAVLGDQKSGVNIETPLATMVQAFRQALAEGGYGGNNEAVLVLDKEVLGKVVYRLNKAEGTRIGVNLAEG